MKQCAKCGSVENITKHHVDGRNKGPFEYLCQSCHDEKHGIQRREETTNLLKRRIRRAKRRIKRDKKIIEEAEAKIGEQTA